MAALYSHTTRSDGLVLTATIYNSDHQNHIDNGVPLQQDDYSLNAAQMKLTVDPGEVGTESLATTQAGEFERLRFAILEMKGTTEWYESPIWITPAFSAGDYTGNVSMTWTVESGDVTTLAYIINGKMMTVAFTLVNTTVGGTPSTQLEIAIPESKVSTKNMSNGIGKLDDNGTSTAGRAFVLPGNTVIRISKPDDSVYAASTNNTSVFGQITFEIN